MVNGSLLCHLNNYGHTRAIRPNELKAIIFPNARLVLLCRVLKLCPKLPINAAPSTWLYGADSAHYQHSERYQHVISVSS